MNTEKIYLSCKLCDKSHQYEYSDSAFNAIEVDWKSPDKNVNLLPITPEIGEKYTVSLHPPLTIKTNNPFWAVYLNPNSTVNGIENEQDLMDIRFCKCIINNLIESNDVHALIEIEVIDIKKIDSLLEKNEPDIQWSTLMDSKESFKRYGSTENFEYYSYLSVNIESDLGINAIIKKEKNSSQIVAINQWDFHLDEWILCRIPLNKEEEIKYGIHRNKYKP